VGGRFGSERPRPGRLPPHWGRAFGGQWAAVPGPLSFPGQPGVVDNRGGANTVIAANHVAQSRPEGETILLTSSSTFATLPNLYATPPVRLDQYVRVRSDICARVYAARCGSALIRACTAAMSCPGATLTST